MINRQYVAALKRRAKVTRLANLRGKSFAFRLAAIIASDSRPGMVWKQLETDQ